MPGPGEYRPDPTEGITRLENLPRPRIIPRSCKMQKAVSRVRTRERIGARIALDLLRDARQQGRRETQDSLHEARAG